MKLPVETIPKRPSQLDVHGPSSMKTVLKSQLNSFVCSIRRWESKSSFARSHQARSASGEANPENLRFKMYLLLVHRKNVELLEALLNQ